MHRLRCIGLPLHIQTLRTWRAISTQGGGGLDPCLAQCRLETALCTRTELRTQLGQIARCRQKAAMRIDHPKMHEQVRRQGLQSKIAFGHPLAGMLTQRLDERNEQGATWLRIV